MNEITKQEVVVNLMKIDDQSDYLTNFDTEGVQVAFPWTKISAFGMAFDSIATTLQNVLNEGGSGIYKVDIKGKGHLMKRKDGTNIGTVIENGEITEQATLTKVNFDPTQLYMAAAMASIDKKLDAIQEDEKKILNYLWIKDDAKLKGNIIFLSDALYGYKQNWDNEYYRKSRSSQVVRILSESEGDIIRYRTLLEAATKKDTFIQRNKTIERQVNDIIKALREYKVALYLHCFASYMDVMLQESFGKEYLDTLTAKLKLYIYQYREIYTYCYDMIKANSSKGLETRIGRRLAQAHETVGKAIENTPIINKGPIDEVLIKNGKLLNDLEDAKEEDILSSLIACKPEDNDFVNQINLVNVLFNDEIVLHLNNDRLAISTI